MPRTGRPKVPGEMAHIRLPPELSQKITDYIASQSNSPAKVTRNDVVRYALEKFFAESDK